MWPFVSQITSWPGRVCAMTHVRLPIDPGRDKQRRLAPEERRRALLQQVERGIFEKHVVADLGLGHGTPHRGGGTGHGVGPQIDSRHEA